MFQIGERTESDEETDQQENKGSGPCRNETESGLLASTRSGDQIGHPVQRQADERDNRSPANEIEDFWNKRQPPRRRLTLHSTADRLLELCGNVASSELRFERGVHCLERLEKLTAARATRHMRVHPHAHIPGKLAVFQKLALELRAGHYAVPFSILLRASASASSLRPRCRYTLTVPIGMSSRRDTSRYDFSSM